ncbi:hypothetical protein EVAR_50346_1 [Eumeta japonica]|uniref:Uncharacterized protein n=1 Tax=Eumeta variegata TaxID=151549 RepID=A0A4C1XRN6_EUMVA|nr:hypothetical protein EVAR_50346_1 [Eumeta japonica]
MRKSMASAYPSREKVPADITELEAELCDVTVYLSTLHATKRQWFHGFGFGRTYVSLLLPRANLSRTSRPWLRRGGSRFRGRKKRRQTTNMNPKTAPLRTPLAHFDNDLAFRFDTGFNSLHVTLIEKPSYSYNTFL